MEEKPGEPMKGLHSKDLKAAPGVPMAEASISFPRLDREGVLIFLFPPLPGVAVSEKKSIVPAMLLKLAAPLSVPAPIGEGCN